MSFKKLTIGILIVLIAACDVSSSNSVKKVNDENKSLNDMSNIENRLSYFEAKKLSIGFLGADITEDIKNNLLTLEHKSKSSNEVNAQFVLAVISFYNGNSIKKNEAIKKFYKLAKIGHPYAALELYKYAKSDINNFNNMKRVTNLSTEILNIKINEFIRLAINNNINAAYYYYSEYLNENHDEIDSWRI